jgi:hypothetical protein
MLPNPTDLTQWNRNYQISYAQAANKPMCERGARFTMLLETVEKNILSKKQPSVDKTGPTASRLSSHTFEDYQS